MHTLYARERQEHPNLLRTPAGIDDYLRCRIPILGCARRRPVLGTPRLILWDESGHDEVVQRDNWLRGCPEQEGRDLDVHVLVDALIHLLILGRGLLDTGILNGQQILRRESVRGGHELERLFAHLVHMH